MFSASVLQKRAQVVKVSSIVLPTALVVTSGHASLISKQKPEQVLPASSQLESQRNETLLKFAKS